MILITLSDGSHTTLSPEFFQKLWEEVLAINPDAIEKWNRIVSWQATESSLSVTDALTGIEPRKEVKKRTQKKLAGNANEYKLAHKMAKERGLSGYEATKFIRDFIKGGRIKNT